MKRAQLLESDENNSEIDLSLCEIVNSHYFLIRLEKNIEFTQ